MLVLQGDEDDAASCHGALPRKNEPRDFDRRSVTQIEELGAGDDAALLHARAQMAHGMVVDREAETRIVEAKLLDSSKWRP